MPVPGGYNLQPVCYKLQGYNLQPGCYKLQGYKATRLQDCRAHRDCKAVSYKATEAARLHVIFNMLLSLVAHKGPADIYIYIYVCIYKC